MQSSEYSYPWPQPSIAYPQYHTSSPATSNPSLAPSPWSFEHAPLPPPYEHAPPSAPPLSSPWDPQIPSLAAVRQRTQSLRETHTSTRSLDANYPPQRLPRGAPPSAALPQADANLFRSSSAAASLQPPTDQRLRTKSDVGQKPLPPLPAELSGASLHRNTSVTSTTSTASFYPPEPEHYYDEYDTAAIDQVDAEIERVAADLAGISLDTEEALLEFQKGELKPEDEEWHKMAPPAALEALGDKEVQRQSVMFEVFKSERDYVADLEAVSSVIIRPLVQSAEDYSKPPIIKREELDSFIQQVFGNFAEIMGFHQVMLGALFARQREQHPLVQSIADLILDLVVRDDFRTAYEVYIKHYPLAESRHKRELDRNPAYKEFLDIASSNPKIRKRDLLTFLSRPVTRLPRLNLLLEQILKKTEQEYQHPDTDTLPIILGILKEVLKSTQPGIEAAENKVKLWEIRDSLLYQKGEIINMDLNDEHRSLVYTSPIFRNDSEWTSLNLTLLDNYLIFIREEKGQGGKIRRYMASRPLPVLYLTLGQFDGPVENRKERTEDGGLFDRYRDVPVYPFVISHASSRSLRRYVLYVASEALRKKWYDAFRDTIGLAKARQEANLWFNPQAISKRSFRLASASNAYVPGRVLNAAPFSVGGQDYIAIGCQAGVYVSRRGEEKYYKVFNLPNPTEIVAVQTSGNQVFNKLLIQYENQVISFSLDVVAKFSQKSADNKMLTASSERVAGQDSSVLLFRHVQIGKRMLLLYTSKRTFSVSPSLNVLEVVDATKQGRGKSFRQHGEPGYVPKDVYEIVALSKNIGVCTKDGIVIIDPLDVSSSAITVVPNIENARSSIEMSILKDRLKEGRPLGLVKLKAGDLLVVYDNIGCYISKYGEPTRSSRFIRWETTAQAYAHRGEHVLLFSPGFIEIRHADTGKLVQVIEGIDIRLLWKGPVQNKKERNGTVDAQAFAGEVLRMEGPDADEDEEPILVAMRDQDGLHDIVMELIETKPIHIIRQEQLEQQRLQDYPYPYPFQQTQNDILFSSGSGEGPGNSQSPFMFPTPQGIPFGGEQGQGYGYGQGRGGYGQGPNYGYGNQPQLSPNGPSSNGVPALWEEWDM